MSARADNAVTVFLSYASPDRARVLPFYRELKKLQFDVWLDCERLKPGQNWDFEVSRALEKAQFVVAFVSNNSVDRRGYVQRELKAVIDKRKELLEDDIYLIPILLDDLEVPHSLASVQYISAADVDCVKKIADAIDHQLKRQGQDRESASARTGVSWVSRAFEERWPGVPGYEVELEWWEFASDKFPDVWQITDEAKGWLFSQLLNEREVRLDVPDFTGFFAKAKPGDWTNTFDAHAGHPNIVGSVLSYSYAIHTYGAGAAHGNINFQTYNYLLSPLVPIRTLDKAFVDTNASLRVVQESARRALGEVVLADGPDESGLNPALVKEGTKDWEALKDFMFTADGIELLFPPYQVGSYADGPQFAVVSYDEVRKFLKPELASALAIG